ncbi:hypothetical protein JG687_00018991, partial [Phytophthora cactorum]
DYQPACGNKTWLICGENSTFISRPLHQSRDAGAPPLYSGALPQGTHRNHPDGGCASQGTIAEIMTHMALMSELFKANTDVQYRKEMIERLRKNF